MGDEGREGLWKLLVGGVSMSIWTGPQFPNTSFVWTSHNSPEQVFLDCGEGCLWRLDKDPTEHADVSTVSANARRLSNMKALAQKANATTFSPDRGHADDLACTTAQSKWNNFWGPFLD